MQFNSYIFTLCFLPFVIVTYFLANKVNKTAGKFLLLAAGIIFYTGLDFSAGIVLGISLAVNYLFVKLMGKAGRNQIQKLCFIVPVVVNIVLLLYFKYTNFAITNINHFFGKEFALRELVLPAGISFFTFQQIAYVTAVYKKELQNISLLDYLVYILYFPKILMGPLMDPIDFLRQLNDESLKKVNADNLLQGVKIFSFGLFKKMIIADTFAAAVSWGFTNFEASTSMDWILIMLFYTFEIYFDFSGYSDMAVGSSLMLNITLPMNFDSPYQALSVRDFWKRWHISLTQFFTKYIYIPLGGNRKGKGFTYLNTFLVFLVSGIWHGANWTFILWGCIYGIFMIFDRIFEKQEENIFEPVRWVLTFAVVNVQWLLFRSESVVQWKGILKKILLFQNTNVNDGLLASFNLPEMGYVSKIFHLDWITGNVRGFWMLTFLIGAFGLCLISKNNYKNLKKTSVLSTLVAGVAFSWAVIYFGVESVFVYFNF